MTRPEMLVEAGKAIRTLPEYEKAGGAKIAARIKTILGITDTGDNNDFNAITDADAALETVQAWVAQAGNPTTPDAPPADEPPAAEPAEPPAPMPAQTTTAADWLASVTPTARGEYQSPSGMRFMMTAHNGATAADLLALVAEVERAHADLLARGYTFTPAPNGSGNGHAAPPADTYNRINASTPPVSNAAASAATTPPPDGSTETATVFGVGECKVGETYRVHVDRVKPSATTSNKPTLDLYRAGDKFRFLTVFERDFGAIKDATGLDPAALDPRAEHTVNLDVLFRLATESGKVKTTSKGNPRLDFAGIAD